MIHHTACDHKPLHELLPVEALVYLNRWAKLKDRFYHYDRDTLYDIKDEKIAEWIAEGELIPAKVIVREPPIIARMKEAIANNGESFEWLNPYDYLDFLSPEEKEKSRFLYRLVDLADYYVSYPEDVYDNWMRQLQPQIEAYDIAYKEYETEAARREPILKRYNQQLKSFAREKAAAAKAWAEENNRAIARTKSKKNLKYNWVERLEKQGFKFHEPAPENPFPKKLNAPTKVKYPEKKYAVNLEDYVPGSIPEVESLLAWAMSIGGEVDDYKEINDEYMTVNFDWSLAEIIMERIKPDIFRLFQDFIDGKFNNATEFYNALTEFPVDFDEAIGTRTWFSYGRSEHGRFGKWHEINLSKTGYWLIEFQSTNNPEITFHSPYNKEFDFDKTVLPRETSDQANFGREIDSDEMELYPIKDLIRILGYSVGRFPYDLACLGEQTFSF